MWAVAGLLAATVALRHTLSAGAPTATVIAFVAAFCVLMAAGFIWPITRDVAEGPDAIDVDEAFFVLLVLLVPASLTVLVFAVAMVVALSIRRRPMAWSAFNVGRVVASVGLGALVFALLHGQQAPPGYAKVESGARRCAVTLLRRQHGCHGLHHVDVGHLRGAGRCSGDSPGGSPGDRRAASASPSPSRCSWPTTRSTSRLPCCPFSSCVR